MSERARPNVTVAGMAPVAVRPPELSGCAVVNSGVLIVEDEAIGTLLFAPDVQENPIRLDPVKLERKKKQRAPYVDRPKLFPLQDFEDIASDREKTVYLIGSHNGKGGERRPDREFLLRVEWDRKDGELKVVGENYDLLEGMAPVLEQLGCNIGLTRETVSDAVNIEGLALHGAHLYIGLRSPLAPGGKAIFLAVEVAACFGGRPPAFEARLLDLDGGGIRAMDWDPKLGTLLVVSGPAAEGATTGPALWQCDTGGQGLERLVQFDAQAARMQPEGVCRLPDGRLLIVLDGEDRAAGSQVLFLED